MVLCDCCESRGNTFGLCNCTPCFCHSCILCSQHCTCSLNGPSYACVDDSGEFPIPPIPDQYPPNLEQPPDSIISIAPD
jgi:hypothetical protein